MYGLRDTKSLSLEEYWDFLQVNECAGMGVRNFPNDDPNLHGCGEYWNQTERRYVNDAIMKASERLKADRWLGFPIRRDYGKPRQIPYQPRPTIGKYVRGLGVETEALVEEVTLTLRDGNSDIIDPVIFDVTVDFTSDDELILKYPTDSYMLNCDAYTIRPTCVTIVGTTATVEIPRCRLLRPEYFRDYTKKDVMDRPNYKDDAYFLESVIVYRNYLNTTTGNNLVWHRNSDNCGLADCVGGSNPGVCSDTKQLACGYVIEQRMGKVQFEPAAYANGSWSKSAFSLHCLPDGIEFNAMRFYYDRYEPMDADITKAIISIAHNNLPERVCNCDLQRIYYDNDVKPLEPPVRLGLGRSTWGIYEAEQIIREFDNDHYSSYRGGML